MPALVTRAHGEFLLMLVNASDGKVAALSVGAASVLGRDEAHVLGRAHGMTGFVRGHCVTFSRIRFRGAVRTRRQASTADAILRSWTVIFET